MNVSEAVDYRRSVRGFLDKPVDPALVKDIVERASRAASGGNLQPWHVDIVHGESIAKLKTIMAEKIANRESETPEYPIYPSGLTQPWEGRRAEVGEMLYTSLNIPREDKMGRAMWFSRNFQFFGAPVGLFISLDRQMGLPQWADAGALLNSIMLLLCEAGLDSCPQECWAVYPKTISAFIGIPPERMLFTGMSIGWRNPDHAINALRSDRAAVDDFTTFHG